MYLITISIATPKESFLIFFFNLLFKNLIVAYGHKTAKKWTVDKIKLTPKGKKLAKILIKKRQRHLPIK